MLLIIDNYDSFTFNLVHYLGELGAKTQVVRNDALTATEAMALGAQAVVLSPGPCDPDRAGICLDMVLACASARVPLLGVCLGHQTLGQSMGGRVVRAGAIVHGKTSPIRHGGAGLFEAVSNPVECTRYHSLIVERESLPDCLEVTAELDDGTIMGLQHKTLPLHGVQFHPESIATQDGKALLANFLKLAGMNVRALSPEAA
ncbi:MAG: aminodeoxychorismate/anthranilate synthase component II [Pseudomonadota bacterium]